MTQTTPTGPASSQAGGSHERLVYLVPQTMASAGSEAFDLLGLASALWRRRWLVLLSTLLFFGAGVTYSLLATPWYRAEVLLLPRDMRSGSAMSSQLSQLGSLASLAGMNIGSGDKVEPLAVLRSRGFARRFIEGNGIAPMLLDDEFGASGTKGITDRGAPLDVRDAIMRFQEDVCRISDDKKTGLVTLAIEWTDPAVAAGWANAMAIAINDEMRERALVEANANVKFLESEMTQTGVVSLQQSMARLLEGEMQKLMLASGNAEFAFRIVDRAEAPKLRARPKRMAISVLAAALGLVIGCIAALVAEALRVRRGG